jgi:hypothetical protein
MAEDVKEKGFIGVTIDYFKADGRTNKIFETISAFAIGVAINVLSKGFTQGFDITSIWSLSSLVVGFASGLGIPAVQDDAIRKATLKYLLSNELYARYRKENISYSDKITNKIFRRYFIKETNENDLIGLKEREYEKQTEDLKSKITDLQSKKLVAKKPEKIQTKINKLELKLSKIQENGVDVQKLGYQPIEMNDVFNFENKKSRVGKQSLQDNSVELHRRKNWFARFYMPVIMMILQGSALSVIKDNVDEVLISSVVFLIILAYTWFNTYQSHLALKEDISLPVEKNRNDLLKDADREYGEWKTINEMEFDFSKPFDKPNKKDPIKKEDIIEKKKVEIKLLGTFGSTKATVQDLPNPGKTDIKEGDSYICLLSSYYSNVAKRRFVTNEQVVFYKGKWMTLKDFNIANTTIKKETK